MQKNTNKRVVNEIKMIHNMTSGIKQNQQFMALCKEEKERKESAGIEHAIQKLIKSA